MPGSFIAMHARGDGTIEDRDEAGVSRVTNVLNRGIWSPNDRQRRNEPVL